MVDKKPQPPISKGAVMTLDMNSLAIANLLIEQGQRPRIRFEKIPLKPDLFDSKDEYSNVHYSSVLSSINGESHAGTDEMRKQGKATSKGATATAIFTQLLSGSPSLLHTHVMKFDDDGPKETASVRLGDTIIVADEAFCESQINAHSWNLFFSTAYQFPATARNNKQLNSTQHFQISCPNLNISDSLFSNYGLPTFEQIDIVSGVCIFNGGTLKRSLEDGVNWKLLNDLKPTLHEMEYIARASSAIADVASVIVSRLRDYSELHALLHGCPAARIRILLDIPSYHYYESVIRKFEDKSCSALSALRWMDAVDLRHDQISQVFTQAVKAELRSRNVLSSEYEIRTTSRMSIVALLMRQSIGNELVPSLDALLEQLQSQEDGLWHSFFSLLTAREKPRDLNDLSNLFYVFEAVKSALTKRNDDERSNMTTKPKHTPNRNSSPSPTPSLTSSTSQSTDSSVSINKAGKRKGIPNSTSKARGLIISIDDPAERRIYSRAQEVLRKIRSSSNHISSPVLLEAYVCRRVFVNGNRTRSRLYHHDSIPEVPLLYSEGEGIAYVPVEPLDVIRRLYGVECSMNLKNYFDAVGL